MVGGAAMLLAYGRERMTRDTGAIFEPKTIVYDEARAMAREKTWLGEDWLNDAVKGFVNGPDPDPDKVRVVFSTDNLTVQVASPKRLLAMKVAAARVERDRDDILTLVEIVGAHTIQDVLDIAYAEYGERLEPRSRFLVEESLGGVLPPGRPGPPSRTARA